MSAENWRDGKPSTVFPPIKYVYSEICLLCLPHVCLKFFFRVFLLMCVPLLTFLSRYDQDRERNECQYNQNKGYVVFSAMGSFFIPMSVMLYVYSKICCVLTSRQHRMTKTEVSGVVVWWYSMWVQSIAVCCTCGGKAFLAIWELYSEQFVSQYYSNRHARST